MAKKDVQQRLRASVEAEDKAVKDRFAKADTLLPGEGKKDFEIKKASGASRDPMPQKVQKDQDAFPFPGSHEDFRLIALLRERLLEKGVSLNRSDIVRAGMFVLLDATDEQFRETLKRLGNVKTRRPVFSSGRGRVRLSRLN